MQEKITGNNYSYIIKLFDEGRKSCFEILCKHKKSNRKSGIANLNFILSNIISLVVDEEEVGDSSVEVSKTQGRKLFDTALSCFKDKSWLQYLESELDTDRMCGEWE